MNSPEVAFIAVTDALGELTILQIVTREFNADGTTRLIRQINNRSVDDELAGMYFEPQRLPIQGWRPFDPRDIPVVDRKYRNALRDNGSAIVCDIEVAKVIALDKIRKERDFSTLDGQWMRASGQKDTATADAIEAERETLRNIPQELIVAMEGATRIEEIDAAVVATLGTRL